MKEARLERVHTVCGNYRRGKMNVWWLPVGGEEILTEWAQGSFLGDRNVPYIDLSGAYIAIYICKISLNYAL